MSIVLYHLTCIIMAWGIFGNHHAIAKNRTLISEKEKGESISGVKTAKVLIFDTQMNPLVNPNRVNSITDNEIKLKPAVLGVEYPYEIAIINKGSKAIQIDSIKLYNPIGDFIISGYNNDFIPPDDYLVVKIRSLHNQPGDFICSFKVYTNLADISNNVPDSIANPVFTLRGNVRNTEVDIVDQGCNYYYIDSKYFNDKKRDTLDPTDLCQCNKTITIVNNGIENVAFSAELLAGSNSHFEFKEYVPSTGFIDFKLNNRIVLTPGQNREITVFYKPMDNIPREYVGTLKFKPESPSSFTLDPIDISFTSVKPSVNIVADTIIYSRPGDTINIPISFSMSNLPKILIDRNQEFRVPTFKVSIPRKSLTSFYNMNFTFNKNIDTLNNFINTNQLGNDIAASQPRYYQFENGFYNLSRNQNITYALGELSLRYFFSEHKTSEIDIEVLNLRFEDLPICYPSISLDTFNIQIQNSEYQADDFCIQFDNEFLSNLRDSTSDFVAAMRVSGEPVMEIQHFLKEPTQTEITLYSINGMKLETIFSGLAKAELQQIRHPMSHLPPGVYVCEMIAGQFRKTVPILLSR
jgi:hypothetical protein